MIVAETTELAACDCCPCRLKCKKGNRGPGPPRHIRQPVEFDTAQADVAGCECERGEPGSRSAHAVGSPEHKGPMFHFRVKGM